jgi:DNA invertase Pin-like site-specific DNA recombinase
MTQAAIYCRISKDAAHDGLGVERQRADCEALAGRLGWTVAATLIDDDRSAYSGKPRPAYRDLLAAVESGAVSAIVAWHPDRLHRSPRELESFIDLVERHGTAVQTVTAGLVDLSTPTGRMQARIVGNVARFESEHKSERIRRKMDELTDAGQPHVGGHRPFGYRRMVGAVAYEIVPEEAALIREAAAAILDDGRSIRSILGDWRARGIHTTMPPTQGQTIKLPDGTEAKLEGPHVAYWQPGPLARMLTSAQLAGLRERHDDRDPKARAARTGHVALSESTVPAILPRDRWRLLRAVLRDPGRRTTRSTARVNLLAGWLVCGRCGHAMIGRPRPDGARRYVCPQKALGGCNGVAILAEPTEAEVLGRVLARLDSPAVRGALAGVGTDGPADPLGERAEAEGRMSELAAAYAAGEIDRREWQAARGILAARLAALPTVARPSLRLPPDVAAAWPALDLDTRRAIVGEVIERVTIGGAVRGRNQFDPERIAVTWRV